MSTCLLAIWYRYWSYDQTEGRGSISPVYSSSRKTRLGFPQTSVRTKLISLLIQQPHEFFFSGPVRCREDLLLAGNNELADRRETRSVSKSSRDRTKYAARLGREALTTCQIARDTLNVGPESRPFRLTASGNQPILAFSPCPSSFSAGQKISTKRCMSQLM